MTAGIDGRGRTRPETLEDLRAFVQGNWKLGPGGSAAALLDRAGEIMERGSVSFGGLATMLERDLDADLLTALVILSSTSVAVLDVGYVLEEDGVEIPLDAKAVSDANFSKSLMHPVTGEPIPDWEEHVFPFVTPNAYLRELVARQASSVPGFPPAA